MKSHGQEWNETEKSFPIMMVIWGIHPGCSGSPKVADGGLLWSRDSTPVSKLLLGGTICLNQGRPKEQWTASNWLSTINAPFVGLTGLCG